MTFYLKAFAKPLRANPIPTLKELPIRRRGFAKPSLRKLFEKTGNPK
jgi:hypothetical protein